jgi:hypothetical protein
METAKTPRWNRRAALLQERRYRDLRNMLGRVQAQTFVR